MCLQIIYIQYRTIGIMVRVFANGQVESYYRPQKMVLDASLLNTQHYKVQIKGKWSNPGEELHPPLHLSVVAIEK